MTLLLDAADRVWLFGQQVCPIIRYKHVYNTITRNCPRCRLLKPKEVKGFDIPIKVANRGAMIFPVDDLPGLLTISKNNTFKEKGLAWVQEQVAQLTDAAARPVQELELVEEDDETSLSTYKTETRRFVKAGVFTFLGVPFTTYLDEADKAERPWLVNIEVCAYLELGNPRQAISDLETFEKDSVHITDAIGRKHLTTLISESGLYTLASKSRKPNARRFRQWVYAEVVPSIRRTGQYSTKPQVEGPDVEVRAMINDNDFLQHKLLELLQFNREHRKQLEVKDHLTDIGLLKAGKETVN